MRLTEMGEQLWKSHRGTLLLLGLLLAANLVLFVVLDQQVLPQVTEQESRFLQRQSEVRQLLRNQGDKSRSPEQHFLLAIQDLTKFHQAIPAYQDFTGVIEELLVLSSRAGLEITQINYSPEELKDSPLLKFSLGFNVAGDYEQLKKFIHSLEQSVRLIVIKQISLQGVEAEGVDLRLSLETYFRPGSRE